MDIGNILSVDIDAQMRSSYLDYAMSVIWSRALPDARDGLKPVHRRILYAMHDMGIRHNTATKKSARIVGEVLGKYHPHGDLAVYDAMARMAQDFSMRYPLVDGQGNFGSVDGDSPAAMRYTEARLAAIAEEMLADIDKNTVDFIDNFDASLQEPVVLPARLPNLLLNGASGIAVGMATNIPPHNLREVVAAVDYLIDNYDQIDEITVDDLMKHISGPDFPTGGLLLGVENIRQAYSTGRGRMVVRGLAAIEDMAGGRHSIVITEIPYQVNKANLIERMAELVHEGRIDDISDLRDESDRTGMRIVVELKRGAQPHKVLNQLYKYTPLQSSFSMHLLALVNGEPRVLSLKRALHIFIQHRETVITRRSQFELDKARRRLHVLDGLLIALANLDAIIDTIRHADDADDAKTKLVTRFNLTEIQAQAILDLQLRRLAALEQHKIEAEHAEVRGQIDYLEDLLAHPAKILQVIKTDLNEISQKYGDERCTRIAHDAQEDFKEEDLVADEPVLVSVTQRGYIKRVQLKAYRVLNRGRRGVSGQGMREEDEVNIMVHARTLHNMLFFSDRGKVYSQKVYQIPEANRSDRGTPIINILPLDGGERITAVVAVPDFDQASYCILATVKGRIKRLALSELASVRPSGLIAMTLDSGDELGWACITSGEDDIIMITANGQSLRIPEDSVRPMGRQAAGVRGMRLKKNDLMVSMQVVEENAYLLLVTENGFGKRTAVNEYPVKGRGTGGVTTINQSHLSKIGKVASGRIVQEEDEVTVITSAGMVLRIRVKSINPTGRATRGVRMMDVAEGDTVASLARILPEENSVVVENGVTEKEPDV